MLPLMLIASDVQDNECSKHMDNYLKPKLLIHSTHLAYYLHCHILTLKYLEYPNYDVTRVNIFHLLGLKSLYQGHELPPKKRSKAKPSLSTNLTTIAICSFIYSSRALSTIRQNFASPISS